MISHYPIELAPPPLDPWAAGTGEAPYVTILDSGRPGPRLMISAIVHGNEPCGAIALDLLLRSGFRPLAGRVTLAFVNVAAYQRFDPAAPDLSRFADEDFNRVWDASVLDGPRRSIELDRARALRPLVDDVDFLLDLHSMQQGTAPLALSGATAKGEALARRIGAPALIVSDRGHAAGSRMIDYGAFSDPARPEAAVLIECGQHWERSSASVAIEAMFRFLLAFSAIDPAIVAARAPNALTPAAPQRRIAVTEAVTVTQDRFEFVTPYVGLEVIPRKGTVIGHDGDRPVLTPHDECVLIMPSRRLVRGQTAVRLGHFAD